MPDFNWWQWTLVGAGSLIAVIVVGSVVMVVSLLRNNPDSEKEDW
jgi:hypothetical protein